MTEIITLGTASEYKGGRCCALGFFDAVHDGHLAIISEAVARAKAAGMRSCVQTFTGFMKGRNFTTLSERQSILSELGVDELLVLDFDFIKDYSPEKYFNEVIVDTLNTKFIAAGFDYSFGSKGSGKISDLKAMAEKGNIEIKVFDEMTFVSDEGKKIKISSTFIKDALSEGRVDLAMKLCSGRPFSYSGEIIHGKELGRELGFPTINILIPDDKIVVRRGVYYSETCIAGKVYKSVTNVGRRPTVENAVSDLAETYIFDFDRIAYGEFAEVRLLKFARPERKFSSASELARQVNEDKENALKFAEKK